MNKNQILINLSESKQTGFGKQEFAEQSFPQKVFSAIWAVESEVNNGGFSQYLLTVARNQRRSLWKPLKLLALQRLRVSADVP
jgi:hypothetical protein